jgi:hypothetical protein
VPPLLGEGLVARALHLQDADVVWLRGVLEGYEELASLFGDGSGEVVLACPESRVAELDALLADLSAELGLGLASDGAAEAGGRERDRDREDGGAQ